jgi:hypothetical protein
MCISEKKNRKNRNFPRNILNGERTTCEKTETASWRYLLLVLASHQQTQPLSTRRSRCVWSPFGMVDLKNRAAIDEDLKRSDTLFVKV